MPVELPPPGSITTTPFTFTAANIVPGPALPPAPTNPMIALRHSTDGGRTWGNERLRAMGGPGATRTRVIWRNLGQGRDWALEIVITDAVPRHVFGGQAVVSPGLT